MGIIISTLDCTNEIKTKLQDLNHSGVDFMIAENRSKDYTLFQIDFDKSSSVGNLRYLADIIADVVVNELEKKFINRIIKHKYQQFSPDERARIEKLAFKHLNKREDKNNKSLNKIVRKKEIVAQIINYLNKNSDLNVEGFVRFRLKNYLDDLKLAVERAVDEFVIEKEYNEFIELLRYFVEIQEPRIGLVNVLQETDGSFQIMDSNENIIKNEYLEGYLVDMFDGEVEYEDLLVSALINIAPEKILLHFDDAEVEKTVKSIFGERVSICQGCYLCQPRCKKE